mgnify:CR=1 FL=1
MNNNEIILKTAKELAKENPKGWTGDSCDFVSASVLHSQDLTNIEVNDFMSTYMGMSYYWDGVEFQFFRQGLNSKMIIKKL